MSLSSENIHGYAVYFALVLIFCFALSFAGRYHWLPDLLAQFKIQYFAGAIILFTALIIFKSYALAFALIGIAITSYIQTRSPMHDPWLFTAPNSIQGKPVLQIMQYNKFYKNRPYKRLENWIAQDGAERDVILIQEVEDKDIDPMKAVFAKTHPYTMPATSKRPDYVMIFSKHEIRNLEIRPICGDVCGTHGVRFEIQPDGFPKPVTIYTVHTKIPLEYRAWREHRAELEGMAHWIAQDASENIIFLGDWNTTPYATGFQNMQAISGMKYQNYGTLPESTWASFFLLPIFQIPIDHILFKGNLALQDIKKGSAFFSDHHSLHASFTVE